MPDTPELANTVLKPSATGVPSPDHAKTVQIDGSEGGNGPTRAAPSKSGGLVAANDFKALAAEGRRSTILPHAHHGAAVPSLTIARRERFEELAPIGAGGMGEIVLIKDHDIDRAVALKRLPLSAEPEQVLRFVEEIRTVGNLEHPGIVPLHDVGIDDQGRYFFLMKHLKGETLESIIGKLKTGDAAAHARFTFTVRQQIFLNLLQAMAYAHGQGVLHRDIKPANVMVGPFGEVTVLDWGLAKRVGTPTPEVKAGEPAPLEVSGRSSLHTQAGAVMGTPFYMSPEQIRGEPLDERTDTYSLTVLFHELMGLTHYLEGRKSLAQIFDGVQSDAPSGFSMARHPLQPVLPAEVAWFVDKGMKKNREDRYQTVREMIDTLQRGFDGHIQVQCHRTLLKRVLAETSRIADAHPVAVMLGGLASMGLVVAALLKSVMVLW